MMQRIFSILCTLQHEVYRRQVKETIGTPTEESGGFHGSYLN